MKGVGVVGGGEGFDGRGVRDRGGERVLIFDVVDVF